jgi:hypothetical protein
MIEQLGYKKSVLMRDEGPWILALTEAVGEESDVEVVRAAPVGDH